MFRHYTFFFQWCAVAAYNVFICKSLRNERIQFKALPSKLWKQQILHTSWWEDKHTDTPATNLWWFCTPMSILSQAPQEREEWWDVKRGNCLAVARHDGRRQRNLGWIPKKTKRSSEDSESKFECQKTWQPECQQKTKGCRMSEDMPKLCVEKIPKTECRSVLQSVGQVRRFFLAFFHIILAADWGAGVFSTLEATDSSFSKRKRWGTIWVLETAPT